MLLAKGCDQVLNLSSMHHLKNLFMAGQRGREASPGWVQRQLFADFGMHELQDRRGW